jgi:hypothetical protein
MRRALAAAALAALVLTAGCVSAPAGTDSTNNVETATTTTSTASPVSDEYDDRVDTVQVAPGETARVTVSLQNVGELYLPPGTGNDPLEDDPALTVETGWNRLSPEPQRVVQTAPPYYVWETLQSNVSVTLTVEVSPDAAPGVYNVVYEAYNDTSHDHEHGTFGTLRVEVVAE